ncbi:MAG: DnaB-like helicase C-terminal domain-containing protein [Planctomycetota bacterium]
MSSDTAPRGRIDRRKQAQRDEAASEAMSGRRSPPHDPGAERGVLAAITWSPTARSLAFEQLDERHFYLPQHQRIYNALDQLNQENREIDALVVKDKLKTLGTLEDAGGEAFVDEVLTSETSGLHISEYIEILLNQTIARRLHHLAQEVLADVHAGGASPTAILDDVSGTLLQIAEDRLKDQNVYIDRPMDEIFREMQQAAQDGFFIKPSVTSGFPSLDKALDGGFKPGELIVIAARPGIGKTTFMLNSIRGVIEKSRPSQVEVPIAVFSLEMTEKQLSENLLASISKTDARLIKSRTFFSDQRNIRDEEAFNNVVGGITELRAKKIIIQMAPGMNVRILGSKLKRYLQNPGVKAAYIDYLQLMAPVKTSNSRQEDVAGMSTAMKRLALSLNIPIIVLSQLNRGPENRTSPEPQLADLRESGAIEQDADVVMMLYREEKDEALTNTVRVRIAKNRNGPTTSGERNVKLGFRSSMFRLDEQTDEYNPI